MSDLSTPPASPADATLDALDEDAQRALIVDDDEVDAIADATLPRYKQLWHGVLAVFQGAWLMLRHPSLLLLSLVFGAIWVGLLVAVLVGAVFTAGPIVEAFGLTSGFWYVLSWIGVFVLLLPLAYLVHMLLAELVTWQLQEQLSARTERLLDPDRVFPAAPLGLLAILRETLRAFLKMGLIYLLMLLVSFIPVVGQALVLTLGVYMAGNEIALGLLSLPMGRRGFDDTAVREHYEQRRFLWLGAGGTIALLALIPLLGIVLVPAGVIGVTATYHRLEARGHLPREPAPGPEPVALSA